MEAAIASAKSFNFGHNREPKTGQKVGEDGVLRYAKAATILLAD